MPEPELAMNCGLSFLTPEEFFLGKAAVPFNLKGWDPLTHDHDGEGFLPPAPAFAVNYPSPLS